MVYSFVGKLSNPEKACESQRKGSLDHEIIIVGSSQVMEHMEEVGTGKWRSCTRS